MTHGRKVAILTTLPTTIAGFYLEIANALRSSGIEVILCASNGKEISEIKELGYEVKTLPMSRNPFFPGNIMSIFLLAIYLRKKKIDCVETSTPIASVIGRLASAIAGVPIRINTIRGMFPKETHRLEAIAFEMIERLLSPLTSLTLTINTEDRQRVLAKWRGRTNVVDLLPCGGCGVDLERFNKNAYNEMKIDHLKKRFNIGKTDFVITYIGRLSKDKGVFDFIDIIKFLSANEHFKFMVVGDALSGERQAINSKELKIRLKKEGFADKTIVTGFRKDIPDLLSISDVVVLPSYREGFGMVLAEAAAMGKPIVAYENAGTREATKNGETGILVERGNVEALAYAIVQLHRDKELYKTIAEKSLEIAKTEFGKEMVIRKYKEIYSRLLGE